MNQNQHDQSFLAIIGVLLGGTAFFGVLLREPIMVIIPGGLFVLFFVFFTRGSKGDTS